MILVDTNVLMYASGREHENKAPALALLERVARGEVRAAIDAEVLQEIIHRYRSIGRWKDGQLVYSLSRSLFPEVLDISGPVMDRAKKIADTDPSVTARDAVHAAVVGHYKLDGIATFDGDFDRIRGCRRVEILAADRP
jgi:predicted nucleic acid-binding protein